MRNQLKFFLFLFVVFSITYVLRSEENWPILKGQYLGQKLPGKIPEIFAPGIISHGFHENGIFFSLDGKEIFYSTSDSKYVFKTFMYLKIENNQWSAPEPAPFSKGEYTHSAFFSPDGRKLYFSSKRPVDADGAQKKDLDIWVIEKKGRLWGKPVHLKDPLNTDKSEQITSVSKNGTIYLRTDYQGKGKWAIYFSRMKDGKYLAAEKMSNVINAGYNEGNPCISTDESFLIFKSGRPGGYGNTDLYVSFKLSDGSWDEPINLGPQINSPQYELEPRLSPDGKYLFFTSFRKHHPSIFKGKTYSQLIKLYRHPQNGYGTLYWVDAKVIYQLKPKENR
jgi:Tol biopolymer transport system component